MKTLHNKIKIATGIFVIAALAVSCIPKQETMGDAGQTLVKLFPSGYTMLAVDALNTSQTAILFEVRRDVQSNSALNSATTVVLKYDADTAVLKKYNTANETSYIPLPDTLGTISPAITGGNVTLNFAQGDIGQAVRITLPYSGHFDFSAHYALAFTVLSVSGSGTLSAGVKDTIVCEILAKNKWDGIYTVTGTWVDYVYDGGGTSYTNDYPITVQLRTIGATTCARYDADGASYGYVFNGGTSAFGAWTPSFVFDNDNNVVDCVNTSVDSPARGRACYLYTGEGAINKWNASDKSMDVSFGMFQLNVSPQYRSLMVEHYVYKGPR
jgi:hypothetical protein